MIRHVNKAGLDSLGILDLIPYMQFKDSSLYTGKFRTLL